MSQLNRRQFVKQSLFAAGATFAIGGTKSSGNILGANDAIRVGVAGLNGRGHSHTDAFTKIKGVNVTYLIDPDSKTFEKHVEKIKKSGGVAPKQVKDIREALEDKNLDAISIATPNHWHALMTIWGCQAGKDVYVEKPCSHNVHEGRIAVEAARKFNRIVQHGTQSRSSSEWANIAELVKSGKYGKLLVSRGLCYKDGGTGGSTRADIGVKPTKEPPANLDFNLWLGPAKDQPYHENLVHYRWHWFWDFGNGDMGNQGVHQMDIARWLIPGATLPKSVMAFGGRLGFKDQGQTACSQVCVFDYGETQLVFETRGQPSKEYMGQKVGNTLHLTEGTIAGGKFFANGKTEGEPLPKSSATRGPQAESVEGGRPEGHFANFIAAVRSRKQSDLNADILDGHYSAALCHLGNVSYRLGEPVPFSGVPQTIRNDKVVGDALTRLEQHLTGDVKLNLSDLKLTVGKTLAFDTKSETFPTNSAANQLLTREYRKPFAVPEKLA